MRADLPNAVVLSVLGHFGQRTFSTDEFGDQVKAQFPADWATLESTYATGGKGAGAPYSANSAVSTILRGWSKRGVVENLGLSRATFTFGAPRVLHWRVRQSSPDENFYPDEVTEEAAFHEGALLRVLVDRYERDEQARSKCIEHYGPICAACTDGLVIMATINRSRLSVRKVAPRNFDCFVTCFFKKQRQQNSCGARASATFDRDARGF